MKFFIAYALAFAALLPIWYWAVHITLDWWDERMERRDYHRDHDLRPGHYRAHIEDDIWIEVMEDE